MVRMVNEIPRRPAAFDRDLINDALADLDAGWISSSMEARFGLAIMRHHDLIENPAESRERPGIVLIDE